MKDLDLPGIKKRPSLAPPAPPPSHAPPAPTTHELFDVETAAVDYERQRKAERAALRASARPHPPRPSQKSISDAEANGSEQAMGGASAGDPVQKLSTPLSWAAARDPSLEEASEDLLEPVVDSAPLALPPVESSEPLASAIPTGSVVSLPNSAPKKRSGALIAVACGAVGLISVGWFVASGGGARGESRERSAELGSDPVATSEQAASDANPALRVPLPPLELDIGVPASPPPSASAAPADPSSVPPVAPKGVLPEKPDKPEEPPTEELPPFDSKAATAALNQAAAAVSTCRREGDPPGSATVIVRYAPSGRVTSSTVEAGPFAGTVTGGCIATTFRKARVPAFSGDYVTVKKTVSIR